MYIGRHMWMSPTGVCWQICCGDSSIMSDAAVGGIISVTVNSLFKVLEERTIFFCFTQ